MDTIVRNVGDIDAHDLKAIEHVLGRALHSNQQLLIRVVEERVKDAPALPNWCNVYAGLTDQEIAELEEVILARADLSQTAD